MGFSCTIKAGKVDLTKFDKGPIHHSLLGLGPNTDGATPAPYRVTDFREVVQRCIYGTRLKDAAQDAFRTLQAMAKANLESLKQEKHCESCTCDLPDIKPEWWDPDSCRRLLEIDPSTITFMEGSW